MSKTSPKSTKKRPDYAFRFVAGALDETQKEECRGWHIDEASMSEKMGELIKDGFKFTLSDDPNGAGFMCILMPRDTQHKFYGWMLSGRGSTWFKAIKQTLYRHFMVFDGEWPLDKEQQSTEDYND